MNNLHDINEAKQHDESLRTVVADLYTRLVATSIEVDRQIHGLTYQGLTGSKLRNLLLGSALMDLSAHYLAGLVELDTTAKSSRLGAGEVQQLARDMLGSFMAQEVERRRDHYREFVKILGSSKLVRRLRKATSPANG
jgi:hypothetical protein